MIKRFRLLTVRHFGRIDSATMREVNLSNRSIANQQLAVRFLEPIFITGGKE
jgi:hypothetical protein